jgi:hypothetical protein
MSEANRCPSCGAPLPLPSEPSPAGTPLPPLSDLAGQSEPGQVSPEQPLPDVPLVPLLASGSQDDSFIAPHSGRAPVAVAPARSASSANFPALNIDALHSHGPRLSPYSKAAHESSASDEGEEFEPEERRTSLLNVVLISYASALTLALAWTLWKDRARVKADAVDSPPTAVVPDSARQSDLSRKVEPPEPILDEHFATIGRPIRVGSLEITPVDVRRQDVTLQRSNPYATPATRPGGKKALFLLLKLRNTTNDTAFAPLDQAYLRERGKQIVDTFIETADGGRIYPFPLAIESEWSIVGQDFSELRPGESRTVAIVSSPDAPPDTAGPFTWRVRLRTGIGRTDVIGVRWPESAAGEPQPSKSDRGVI